MVRYSLSRYIASDIAIDKYRYNLYLNDTWWGYIDIIPDGFVFDGCGFSDVHITFSACSELLKVRSCTYIYYERYVKNPTIENLYRLYVYTLTYIYYLITKDKKYLNKKELLLADVLTKYLRLN